MSDAHKIHVRTATTARSEVQSAISTPSESTKITVRTSASRTPAQSLVVTPRPAKQAGPRLQLVHSAPSVWKGPLTTPSHVKAHQPQPAKTLMRTAVKRPGVSLRRQARAQTRTDVLVKSPQFEIGQKLSIRSVNPHREHRAKSTAKSPTIQRFAPDKASWFRQQVQATAPATTVQRTPAAPARPNTTNRSMDIFQKALATATAHEQPAHNPKQATRAHHTRTTRPIHHRLTSVVAMSAAVLILAGFFAYQNKPGITLRFASAKAGFHATLPSYQPQGYAAGTFKYSAGQVAVHFAKPGTSRNYTLTQQRSVASAQSVINTVASNGSSYQTLQNGNNTIYLSNNGDAAWVTKGILYNITSDGNLTPGDVLSIATSV